MAQRPVRDALYFLRRFVREPRHVASIWPSSRFLAQRMLGGLSLSSGDLVLEYGPGTGAFTVEVARLCAEGAGLRYLGIEKDAGMYAFLRRRFPELEFELGDVRDVQAICRARRLPPAAAVISGVPLILLDKPELAAVVTATGACLRPDGVFRTFSYMHSYPTRSAGWLRELMGAGFESFELSTPVLRNLPPAMVLSGSRPRVAAAAVDYARA